MWRTFPQPAPPAGLLFPVVFLAFWSGIEYHHLAVRGRRAADPVGGRFHVGRDHPHGTPQVAPYNLYETFAISLQRWPSEWSLR